MAMISVNIEAEKLICVIAMQRSGHHAVINWIAAQINRPIKFVNAFDHADWVIDYNKHLKGTPYLITNFEDFPIQTTLNAISQNAEFAKEADIYLVLRNPYNLLASRHFAQFHKKTHDQKEALAIWYDHAHEFIRTTRKINDSQFRPIAYDTWFQHPEYREHLAQSWFGHESRERSLNLVPNSGMGSSFDGQAYNGKARKMKVLDRWRRLLKDEYHQKLFRNNPQLLHLTLQIFGEAPGLII